MAEPKSPLVRRVVTVKDRIRGRTYKAARWVKDDPQVTKRAAVLPLAEYTDGKVRPAIPGILHSLLHAPSRFMQATAEAQKAGGDWKAAGYAAGEVATNLAGVGSAVPRPAASVGMAGRPAAKAPLDMSQEARFGRAKAMGFDPAPVYHGTDKVFSEFKVGMPGSNSTLFGPEPVTRAAVFFAESKELAAEFAGQGARKGTVGSYLIRTEQVLDASKHGFGVLPETFFEKHALSPRYYHGLRADEVWRAFDVQEGGREFVKVLQKEGYDSVRMLDIATGDVKNTISYAVFDPRNIRSTNAAFDPARARSPNLLSVNAGNPVLAVPVAYPDFRKERR